MGADRGAVIEAPVVTMGDIADIICRLPLPDITIIIITTADMAEDVWDVASLFLAR